MPVRKRRSKRRVDPLAEAQAWSCYFATGWDFFEEAGELTGMIEPVHVWPPEGRPEAEREWLATARDAWRRLGRLYLDNDLGRGLASHDRGEPWALVNFGEPESCQ